MEILTTDADSRTYIHVASMSDSSINTRDRLPQFLTRISPSMHSRASISTWISELHCQKAITSPMMPFLTHATSPALASPKRRTACVDLRKAMPMNRSCIFKIKVKIIKMLKGDWESIYIYIYIYYIKDAIPLISRLHGRNKKQAV